MLTQYIHNEIKNEGGAISFASYMQYALYHPEWGYYNQKHVNFGKHGDFTTAPEISPLFAECIAQSCETILREMTASAILEIGAGSGRLAKDLLISLAKLNAMPQTYYILEISLVLRKQQRVFLQKHCPDFFARIKWIDKLPHDFSGIVLANEVLDALPVHCFEMKDGRPYERLVSHNGSHFCWSLSPANSELRSRLQSLALPPTYASEINLNLTHFIASLSQSIKSGIVLLFDYGYGEREYYHPQRNQGSLTCFYQHTQHNNPFIHVGKQDITAHVNFTDVIRTAVNYEFNLAGFCTQANFLLDCGLVDMATKMEAKFSEIEKFELHQAIKLLTLPSEMGERIKVMAIEKNCPYPLRGFGFNDRMRDL